jgi:hypothetical protein
MAARLLSLERQAELLARYPNEGNAALAADFGLTAAQVAGIAYANHVCKTRATLSAVLAASAGSDSVMKQVLAVVKAAGTAGMCRNEIRTALPGVCVDHSPDSLAARGHLHAAGRRGARRWFADAADAEVHSVRCGTPVPRPRASARRTTSHPPEGTSTAAPPATPCPPVLGRTYQATEASSSLFKDLGPGQYADDTPRSWVAAITRRA